jgi:acyl carrier protein
LQKLSSIRSRIWKSIIKIKPELAKEEMSLDKHLHYDYGLDSLEYEKLVLLLEDEWSIEIEEEFTRSGFFASVEGIAEFLITYKDVLNR